MEICIERVTNGAFFVTDLFREVFAQPAPTDPVHYVAFVKQPDGSFQVGGYYHVDYKGPYALVGGLCVDPRFRRFGIGKMLELAAFENVGSADAFFAHVGDSTRARRVGFEDTGRPHIVVRWMTSLDESQRHAAIDAVAAMGPF